MVVERQDERCGAAAWRISIQCLYLFTVLYFIRSVLHYLTVIGCISSAVSCIHYGVNRKLAVIGSRCSRTFCIHYDIIWKIDLIGFSSIRIVLIQAYIMTSI